MPLNENLLTLGVIIESCNNPKIMDTGVLFIEGESLFRNISSLLESRYISETFPFSDPRDIEYLNQHKVRFFYPTKDGLDYYNSIFKSRSYKSLIKQALAFFFGGN